MAERDVVARIRKANAGRDPRLLFLKYQKMSADPFAFLRGSCHLFHQDWPAGGPLDATPRSWICGDLHLENFGCIAGARGELRFEVNDYDECFLAPVARDLARFVTSLFLGAGRPEAELSQTKRRRRLADGFLDAYATALKKGALRPIDRRNAVKPVREELIEAEALTAKALLRQRTEPVVSDIPRLEINGEKTLALRDGDRASVDACWRAFRKAYPRERRLRLTDAARRISGTGSLGIGRYVLLVETGRNASPYRLLDLKRVRAPTLAKADRSRQPRWKSESVRVAEVARRLQAPLERPVWAFSTAEGDWLVRSLQPSEQRFELEVALLEQRPLATVVEDMGRAVVAAQLRAAGWRGADPFTLLRFFAADRGWRKPVLAHAEAYARAVEADHHRFCEAWRKGELDL